MVPSPPGGLESPSPRPPTTSKPARNLWLVLAVIGGSIVLILLLCGVGTVAWLASGPESGVKLSHQMDDYAEEYIAEHGILTPDERLKAYYDRTLAMDGSEAYILTDQRIIHHDNGKDTWLELARVVDIQHETDTFIGDIFLIEDESGELLQVEIDPLNGGATMKKALDAAWKHARPE